MQNNYIHSYRIATIGTILNQEFSVLSDKHYFMDYTLKEELYELKTHKVIVRAINKLKELGKPITSVTVLEFLEQYKIPSTLNEEKQILEVLSEYPLTVRTFDYYIEQLNKNILKEFRI